MHAREVGLVLTYWEPGKGTGGTRFKLEIPRPRASLTRTSTRRFRSSECWKKKSRGAAPAPAHHIAKIKHLFNRHFQSRGGPCRKKRKAPRPPLAANSQRTPLGPGPPATPPHSPLASPPPRGNAEGARRRSIGSWSIDSSVDRSIGRSADRLTSARLHRRCAGSARAARRAPWAPPAPPSARS